jgi:hypothetical protein
MFLARLEGGSCICHTATTDNAAQKYYLKAYYKVLFLDCVIGRRGMTNTVSSL